MARRIVIKTKTGDKIEYHRPLLAEDDWSHIGIKTPIYGWPEFTIEGDFTIEIEDLKDYVQVEFCMPMSGKPVGRLYTYIDPGLKLAVGDLVEVPTQFKKHNLAVVRQLGPDDRVLAEFIVKEVAARYTKIEKEEKADGYGVEAYGCFCPDSPYCYCDRD